MLLYQARYYIYENIYYKKKKNFEEKAGIQIFHQSILSSEIALKPCAFSHR